ncbi:MAG: hypothetical protein Q8Q73_10660 [Stagnimonas sp.]|nr:hypothetical protein [Stagnimonas sp.]
MNRPACLCLLLALAACKPAESPVVQSPAEPEGRAETQGIRNLDAVGVSGSAIADKVDGALDAAEQRKRELEAQDPP